MTRYAINMLLACCFVLALGTNQRALANELRTTITPLASTARSCAPIALTWKIDWQGRGLLEGAIEITVRDESLAIYSQRIDDVVLQPGENAFRSMLPAFASSDPYGMANIHASFVTPHETYSLGKHPIRAPTAWKRSFVVAIATSEEAGPLRLPDGMFTIRIDADKKGDASDTSIRPAYARVPIERMPSDPLDYCSFDIVLVTGEAIEQMRDKAIAALEQWVHAGGSLLLVAGETPGAKQHQFIARLEARGLDWQPYGEKSFRDPNMWSDRQLEVELGRVAITERLPQNESDVAHSQWEEMLAFLWKLRIDQIGSFVIDGRLARSNDYYNDFNYRRYDESYATSGLSPVRNRETDAWLRETLMPDDIRMVPLSGLTLILLIYIVIIGPLDYWVLGKLRRRRWTWITFPAATFGVTALVVWMSNHYLSSSKPTRSLHVIDLASDGSILRQSKLSLHFYGSRQQVATDVENGLAMPLGGLPATDYAMEDDYIRLHEEPRPATPTIPHFAGRLPQRFSLTQQVEQWSPRLQRVFQLAPATDATSFAWSSSENDEWRSAEFAKRVVDAARNAFGEKAVVYAVFGSGIYKLRSGAPSRKTNGDHYFLHSTDVRDSAGSGLFAYASRLSPHGGGMIEDLQIVDPTDPTQLLLVISVERGGDLYFYRRLIRVPNP